VNHTVRLGLVVAMMILAFVAVLGSRFITLSHLPSTAVAFDEPHGQGILVGTPRAAETDGLIDLYGNDISSAVAEYSIDPLGSPYEVHSPQTELPRLASPKS